MSDNGIAWRNVSRGLYLIGFGCFLFLNTQDLLPWTFWREALVYWPVGLVALGIRLLFERTRMPWLILLGPALVIGTLAHVAWREEPRWDHEWAALEAERPADASRWTLEGSLGMVDLDIRARDLPGGRLVAGRGSPPGRSRVRVSQRGEAARVRISSARRGLGPVVLPGFSRRLELGVSPDLPLAVDFNIAFGEGTIDLAAAPVSRVDLDGAFNDLEMELGAPASDVRLDLKGAFSRLIVWVPAETPVRYDSDGFLNFVDGRSGAGERRGPGYRLDLNGFLNSVSIRSR